jgi:hypothetical protein
MAGIDQEVKAFIVTRLACFDSIPDVVRATKEEFGVTVSRQQVQFYDPTSKAGQRLGAKMKRLFKEQREKFLKRTSSIPIAHKSVRLRTLQRLVTKAEERGNSAMVASLLEQAAKEMGGMFVGRTRVEFSGVVGHMNVPPPAPGTVPPNEAYRMMSGVSRRTRDDEESTT